jgi:hypothetical protein
VSAELYAQSSAMSKTRVWSLFSENSMLSHRDDLEGCTDNLSAFRQPEDVTVYWFDRRNATSACNAVTDPGCQYQIYGIQSATGRPSLEVPLLRLMEVESYSACSG